jgi:hypothetical protein
MESHLKMGTFVLLMFWEAISKSSLTQKFLQLHSKLSPASVSRGVDQADGRRYRRLRGDTVSPERGMSPRKIPDTIVRMDTTNLDDEALAATAYVLRQRAKLGDRQARRAMDEVEAELTRRIGPTPSQTGALENVGRAGMQKPWWRLWGGKGKESGALDRNRTCI